MMRLFSLLFLSCVLVHGAIAADSTATGKADSFLDVVEKIRPAKVRLFFYSLDPNDMRLAKGKLSEKSDKVFYRWVILGKTEIVPLQGKTDLLNAFVKGMRESDGAVAHCFDPRHGLRVIDESRTNDFVICFQCRQVEAYNHSNGKFYATAATTSSPEPTFDQYLKKYKLKKAK